MEMNRIKQILMSDKAEYLLLEQITRLVGVGEPYGKLVEELGSVEAMKERIRGTWGAHLPEHHIDIPLEFYQRRGEDWEVLLKRIRQDDCLDYTIPVAEMLE